MQGPGTGRRVPSRSRGLEAPLLQLRQVKRRVPEAPTTENARSSRHSSGAHLWEAPVEDLLGFDGAVGLDAPQLLRLPGLGEGDGHRPLLPHTHADQAVHQTCSKEGIK